MKKNEQEILLNMDEALAQMAEETPEMPEDFHAAWVRAVEEAQPDQQQNPEPVSPDVPVRKSGKMLVLWTRLAAAAAAVAVLIGGTVATRNSRLEEKTAAVTYTTAAYIPHEEETDFGSMPAYGSTAPASAKSAQSNGAVMDEAAEEAVYMDADCVAEAPVAGSSDTAAPVSEKEEEEVREKTFFERVGAGFVSGLESLGEFLSDMAVFVVSALPWILLLAVAVIVIRVVIRKRGAAKSDKD